MQGFIVFVGLFKAKGKKEISPFHCPGIMWITFCLFHSAMQTKKNTSGECPKPYPGVTRVFHWISGREFEPLAMVTFILQCTSILTF